LIENEPKITYHPKSCYTSRKIDYSAKLNKVLAPWKLSDKIVVMEDDDDKYETSMSESLGTCGKTILFLNIFLFQKIILTFFFKLADCIIEEVNTDKYEQNYD
jgi:hypothetical protein